MKKKYFYLIVITIFLVFTTSVNSCLVFYKLSNSYHIFFDEEIINSNNLKNFYNINDSNLHFEEIKSKNNIYPNLYYLNFPAQERYKINGRIDKNYELPKNETQRKIILKDKLKKLVDENILLINDSEIEEIINVSKTNLIIKKIETGFIFKDKKWYSFDKGNCYSVEDVNEIISMSDTKDKTKQKIILKTIFLILLFFILVISLEIRKNKKRLKQKNKK